MKRQSMAIVCALLAFALAHADPPPFGTVVQRWPLRMSGSYAGAGMTWRRDSGKFYLMDQGYSGRTRVWNLDPADPPGTTESVPWTFVNLGQPTTDIPWGIAWDSDSGCFWVSQILDNNVYGGCYLLRHVWSGSSWVWGGTARDSWFVGDGSNGGGLRCLWVAGMEKNELTGVFYFAPVATSPSTLNHIGKFDPYTKTDLGRLQSGDQTSHRGCALIPWDSAYILTSGWNLGLVKIDTLGRIVQRADSGGGGPADLAVEVPNLPEPDSTVWFYMIGSNASNYVSKVSTGLVWRQLPSANRHSVRPSAVLAPVGAVDSGQTVVPVLVVRNDAEVTAGNVSVHFVIDDQADRVIYHDSLIVTLASRSADTVEFTAWTATGRDSMAATVWTCWVHDSLRRDDTLSARFLVRVQDVGITDVLSPVPDDTIDPGWVRPRCRVRNYGNVTVTFPLVFGIDGWQDTMTVANLLAGGTRVVTAGDSCETTGDTLPCTVTMSCRLDGDLHPENNDTAYRFWVRSPIVEIESIIAPVDTLLVNDTVRPMVRVANRGSATAEFWMYFRVSDSLSAVVYFDSVPIVLPVGMRTTAVYSELVVGEAGEHAARCSAHIDAGHAVVASRKFWVIDPVGMKERGPKPVASVLSAVRIPTVVGRMLILPPRAGDAELLDITGRRIMDLRPGPNDMRHVAPGIYFTEEGPRGQGFEGPSVRKIVIQR